MPHTTTDDVAIWYEIEGPADGEALVLISGGGAQLLAWQPGFLAPLVDAGFRVIRFDNRDTGMSQRFGGPDDLDGHYGLEDMALDVVRILDSEGIDAAHVVGHSMGGIIAQLLAIHHPERTRSITLVSTIPGTDPAWVVTPGLPEIYTRPQEFHSRETVVEGSLKMQAWYHQGSDWNADAARAIAELAYDRGYHPDGIPRQWAALMRADYDRRGQLSRVTAPVLILHGRDDETCHWKAALDTAEAVPDAELHVYPGMGHLLVENLWPEYTGLIIRHARRAGRKDTHA